MAPWHWSNGGKPSVLAGMSGGGLQRGSAGAQAPASFDDRVREARRQEALWSPSNRESKQAASPSSHRSWQAELPLAARDARAKLWVCRGQWSCGYKLNEDNQQVCQICSRPWQGGLEQQGQSLGRLQTANSFQALAAKPLGKGNQLVPGLQGKGGYPWKKQSKGWHQEPMPEQFGLGKGAAVGKGPSSQPTSPASLVPDDEQMGAEVLEERHLDLDGLRCMAKSLGESLGQEADEVTALWTRIDAEAARRKERMPKGTQLQKLERKMAMVEGKLQKTEALLEAAEQAVAGARKHVEEIQKQGRELQLQYDGLEVERHQLVHGLQASSGISANLSPQDSMAEQLAALVATAHQHVEAGDEKARQLQEALVVAAKFMEEYVVAAKEVLTEEQAKQQTSLPPGKGGGTITPKARTGSRSPRRTDAEGARARALAAAVEEQKLL